MNLKKRQEIKRKWMTAKQAEKLEKCFELMVDNGLLPVEAYLYPMSKENMRNWRLSTVLKTTNYFWMTGKFKRGYCGPVITVKEVYHRI